MSKIIQSVSRDVVAAKIHPNNRKHLPAELFVEEISPLIPLLHPKRFDAMVKYVYANCWKRKIESDWAKRMYLDHLRIIAPGYREGDGSEKQGVAEFLRAFDGILESVSAGGFDRERSIIPVNDEGVIVDGAHRLAACAAFDREITIARPVNHHDHNYSSTWFLERGFSRTWADAVALEYCRINRNSYIAVIWPQAVGMDREIRNTLSSAGRIYYEKVVTLRRPGPANFMKLVYGQHHWIGTWSDGYKGAEDCGEAYFGDAGDLRVFVLDSPDSRLVLNAKREIRDLFGIGNRSIHINDTHQETVAIAQALLNENSIHFLNHASLKETDSYHSLTAVFREFLADESVPSECFCVDSSMVLAAYGVRDARDLDVLHHGHDELVSRFPSGIGSHNQESPHYPCSIDDVIFNPERHFFDRGVKLAALDVVCDMKRRRGEKKDRTDLTLVRRFLKSGPSRGWFRLDRRLRDRIRRDMPPGLLALIRRVRSAIERRVSPACGGISAPHTPPQAAGTGETASFVEASAAVEFTGIVVTYNEVTYLEECLDRLRFCREVIVVDLGSTDGSTQVAEKMGARIVRHELVPVVEMVRAFAVEQARTDWIVFLDPDLIFPPSVLPEVVRIIETVPDVGLIKIPQRNHFNKKPLGYGRWGGITWHPAVLHRGRVNFQDEVHRGIRLKPGYQEQCAPCTRDSIITHYWAASWQALTIKARRYLDQEGAARYKSGDRTTRLKTLWNPIHAFGYSFIWRKGFLDGILGLKLSLFWAWYSYRSELALYQHARRNSK